MKRKMIITLCCVLILCVLTGCQLAQENAGTSPGEDKLIGVFITTEYLDLFDVESYLNDNAISFNGSEITVDGDVKEYEGRLYATLMTVPLTSEETGETTELEEYVFEGVEGVRYFTVTVIDGRDSYSISIADDAIGDGHTSLNFGDDKNSIVMEGTIYTVPSSLKQTFHFNPVYQSADGRVYAVSGIGHTFSDESPLQGVMATHTVEAATTITENGKTKEDSISIAISISVMFEPEKIVILQMDANSEVVSQKEYTPGLLPETLTLEAGTAYFIVETYKKDYTGNPSIVREIYDKDTENIKTFYAGSDGICLIQWTKIIWK